MRSKRKLRFGFELALLSRPWKSSSYRKRTGTIHDSTNLSLIRSSEVVGLLLLYYDPLAWVQTWLNDYYRIEVPNGLELGLLRRAARVPLLCRRNSLAIHPAHLFIVNTSHFNFRPPWLLAGTFVEDQAGRLIKRYSDVRQG